MRRITPRRTHVEGSSKFRVRRKPSLLESGMCRILHCMFMFSLTKYKRKFLVAQTDRGTQRDATAKYLLGRVKLSETFGFHVWVSAKQPPTTTSKTSTTASKTAFTKTQNDETKPKQRSRLIFFDRFIYLLTILLVSVVSHLSVVSFRRFGF